VEVWQLDTSGQPQNAAGKVARLLLSEGISSPTHVNHKGLGLAKSAVHQDAQSLATAWSAWGLTEMQISPQANPHPPQLRVIHLPTLSRRSPSCRLIKLEVISVQTGATLPE